jgi:hypothetical protein
MPRSNFASMAFGTYGWSFRVLSLDDERFSPDAYDLADCWLERIRGD